MPLILPAVKVSNSPQWVNTETHCYSPPFFLQLFCTKRITSLQQKRVQSPRAGDLEEPVQWEIDAVKWKIHWAKTTFGTKWRDREGAWVGWGWLRSEGLTIRWVASSLCVITSRQRSVTLWPHGPLRRHRHTSSARTHTFKKKLNCTRKTQTSCRAKPVTITEFDFRYVEAGKYYEKRYF